MKKMISVILRNGQEKLLGNDECKAFECKELSACDKDLWVKFPDFKKGVIQMQAAFFDSKS